MRFKGHQHVHEKQQAATEVSQGKAQCGNTVACLFRCNNDQQGIIESVGTREANDRDCVKQNGKWPHPGLHQIKRSRREYAKARKGREHALSQPAGVGHGAKNGCQNDNDQAGH